MKKKSAKGFSLIELLVVVTIILIIAMIAIPKILTTLKVTKETAAVTSLKAIIAAQRIYSGTGDNFGTIPDLIAREALDERFGEESMSGYRFTIVASAGEYTAEATPVTANAGRYAYDANADGVVHYSTVTSMAPDGQAGKAVR